MKRFAGLIVGMLLLGVALPLHSQAHSQAQPTPATLTPIQDSYGNPLYTADGKRIEYLVEPEGYFKTILDSDGTIIQREKVPANPFAAQTQPQPGSQAPMDSVPLAAPSSYLTETWRMGIWGTGIGLSGMIPQDLDNNATTEIILAGGYQFGLNRFWYIVAFDPSTNRYQQIWMSRIYAETEIYRIATGDVNQDGRLEIYVALANGLLEVYDAPTRNLKAIIPTGLVGLSAVLIADPNSDGAKEIIVSSPAGTKAYSKSYAPQWQIQQGGNDVAVANVDADAALEIVVNSFVLNGVTRAVEWNFDFGSRLNVVDVNHDGRAEIIASQNWYKIFGFDAELKTRIWEISSQLDIGAVYVADVDNDGNQEIVYGDSQWGAIHVLDGATRLQEWQIANPEHGVTNVAFGDVDGDGATEIIWGAGWSSTGEDNLFVGNSATHTIEWRSTDVGGPLNALDVGDVDGDGRQEIVMVSFESESGYSDGLIFVYDAQTHVLEWQSGPPLGGMAWSGMNALRLADVDNDGRLDIVIATSRLYDGVILVYDGLTHGLKWQSAFYNGTSFTALAIADLDSDGAVEVIAGQQAEHTGSTGAYVVVFDGLTGGEKWRTNSHGYWNGAMNIVVDDIDQNGNLDILFSMGGVAFIYDAVTHINTWQGWSDLTLVSSANVDSAPGPELLLGGNGHLYVLDGKTRQLKRDITVSSGPVLALRLADMNRDGVSELFITSNGYLYVYDVTTWTKIWQSGWMDDLVGYRDHLVVKDINGDSRDDVVMGGIATLSVFSYNDLPYHLQMPVDNRMIKPGDSLTYTAVLVNLANTTASMRLTDTLPVNAELITESLQVSAGTTTLADQKIIWSVAVPAQSQVTITLAVQSQLNAPDGTLLINSATADNGTFKLLRTQTATVDAVAPNLLMLSPTSSEILSGTTVVIRGTASDNRSGVERVEVKLGQAPWQAVEGTTTWSLTWTLPLSDTTVPLRYRAIDRVGNVGEPSAETLVTVDNLAPTLVEVFPAHTSIGVARDQPIILTFSEPIMLESLAWSCQSDPGGWIVTTTNNGHTIRLDHNLFVPNRIYSCYLRVAKDKAGRSFQAGAISNPWGFLTQDRLLLHVYLPQVTRSLQN